MRLPVLLLLAGVQYVTAQQIYFSPPVTVAKEGKGNGNDEQLSATRAAALISHVFGTSHYTATSASNYADLISNDPSTRDGQQLVIMIDCPSSSTGTTDDCGVPKSVQQSSRGGFRLPNLPFASWASLVTLEMHRMAHEYGIDPSRISGLDKLANSIKQVPGWLHWVTKELGDYIGWNDVVSDTRHREFDEGSKILTDANMMDMPGKQLVFDMQSIAQLAEQLNRAHNHPDSGAAPARVHVLHLKGLPHLLSPKAQAKGAEMISHALEALIAGLKPSQVTVLSLPPYRKPLLSKRSPFLDPFRSPQEKYFRPKRDVPTNHLFIHQRRAESSESSGVNSAKSGGDSEDKATKVVPHSHVCFKDAKDVKNQTANCMGRGEPVRGISNYQEDGSDCWVCDCDKGFGGQGCEKQDLSSDFTLLFLSAAGLVLILLASVVLLFGSANEPLPSTLAAVSGAK